MFGQPTYLIWLALFIALPIGFRGLRWPREVWGKRRALGWTLVGGMVGGWLWDGISIQASVWYYDPANIAGIWFGGMPLEEWLWIVGVTLMFGSLTIILMERRRA